MTSLAQMPVRQRMINMMYLVLMAMLALNVSKSILEVFGVINSSLEKNRYLIDKDAIYLLDFYKQRYEENPEKYKNVYDKMVLVSEKSNHIINLISSYKNELTTDLKGDPKFLDSDGNMDFTKMDANTADQLFFPGGLDNKGKAKDLTAVVNEYRDLVISLVSNKRLIDKTNEIFDTSPVDRGGVQKVHWLKSKFENFPLSAVFTMLSQIQFDVKSTEVEVFRSVASEGFASDIGVNKFIAYTIPDSRDVVSGNSFKAKVTLIGYDTTMVPEVFLYKFDRKGNQISKEKNELVTKKGVAEIAIPTGGKGKFWWGGVLKIKDKQGEYKSFNFKDYYNVFDPIVVVSPEKMNVLYRGVSDGNPISISVPGVAPKDIIVQTQGIRKIRDNLYSIDVTNFRGRIAKIVVKARYGNTIKNMGVKQFRIKDIPNPMGTVRGETEPSMSLSALKKSTIGVKFDNFDFKVNVVINSFKLKIPGQPSLTIRGNKMNRKSVLYLNKVKVDESIQITNIKASLVGNSRYKIKKVSPVIVNIISK